MRLTPELRTARSPDAIELDLVTEDPRAVHLEVRAEGGDAVADKAALPLAQRILRVLEREAPHALRRSELREVLRVNNAKLGLALSELETMGFARRGEQGWSLARSA